MTRIADTSFLYALFNRSDAHHAKAVAAAQDPEAIQVLEAIMGETLDLIAYRFDGAHARRFFEDLARLPHLELHTRAPASRAAEIYQEEGGLSYADGCVVAAALQVHGVPLSFDGALLAAFRQRTGTHGPPPPS